MFNNIFSSISGIETFFSAEQQSRHHGSQISNFVYFSRSQANMGIENLMRSHQILNFMPIPDFKNDTKKINI